MMARNEDGPQYGYSAPMALCEECGKANHRTGKGTPAKTCSPVCDAARKKRRFEEANGKAYGLPTGTVGALHELTVAVDLLRRGYAVFRALSPTCGCDLAVLKGRDLLRVEVKSAYRGRSGNLILGITKKDRPSARFEILALVERSGRITYLDSARNEVDLGGPTPTVFGP